MWEKGKHTYSTMEKRTKTPEILSFSGLNWKRQKRVKRGRAFHFLKIRKLNWQWCVTKWKVHIPLSSFFSQSTLSDLWEPTIPFKSQLFVTFKWSLKTVDKKHVLSWNKVGSRCPQPLFFRPDLIQCCPVASQKASGVSHKMWSSV